MGLGVSTVGNRGREPNSSPLCSQIMSPIFRSFPAHHKQRLGDRGLELRGRRNWSLGSEVQG